jgi:hypothetical protein
MITYGPFLLYCCFNGCHKSRNIGISTPSCANKLRAMMHSAESRLRAMLTVGVFLKFYLRLCAMQLSVKFKSKIFLSTPRYAAQRYVHHCAESRIFANFSANSQPYAKMISTVHQWPHWETVPLKRQCHEIRFSTLGFFHHNIRPEPLIKGLKPFRT